MSTLSYSCFNVIHSTHVRLCWSVQNDRCHGCSMVSPSQTGWGTVGPDPSYWRQADPWMSPGHHWEKASCSGPQTGPSRDDLLTVSRNKNTFWRRRISSGNKRHAHSRKHRLPRPINDSSPPSTWLNCTGAAVYAETTHPACDPGAAALTAPC